MEMASRSTTTLAMLVKAAFLTGSLRSAIPIDARTSKPRRVFATRVVIHSATPERTGQAFSRRNSVSPHTAA
jgi:hypothetical protein